MFQRSITLEQFADIFEGMEFYQQADTGPVMTTTGIHPELGSVVVVQDMANDLIMLSERPVFTD
jgi:hypothetical protein